MYSVLLRKENAHAEAIWSVSWGRNSNAETQTDTDYIVTGSLDNIVNVWNWDENELREVHKFEKHRLGVISTDINQNATTIVSSSTDCYIRVWDVESGEQITTIDAGPMEAWMVRFSPDGHRIVTGSQGGKISIYNVETGELEHTLECPNQKFILSLAFSPDGRMLAAASQEGIVYIHDMETLQLKSTIEAHAMPIRALSFTPDSQMLVSGADDKYIKLHDITATTSQIVATLPGHTSWVLGVDTSPDKLTFASCSADHSVRVWDIRQRQTLHTFNDHSDQVWGVKYNWDGSRLVSVGEDRTIQIYSIPN
uniref:WD repeat-containing protein 61 n=2 Tax=Plectus sambesii TaxID=2011161 RepID=A0A914WBV5_9BILA